jgi:tetraacyldisaccharide 4'-kinase
MRAPAFWWRQDSSLLARLLRPPAALYGAVAARRLRQPGRPAERPVICIGNFTVGGAGKTPAALAVARLLAAAGEAPFFLTRGYGGRLAGPVRVDPAVHTARDVGDEPLLLARAFPTIVARHRSDGAQLAAAGGASLVIMDDGLQNPALAKDLAFAVVDAAVGTGNGLTLPAGPLRAPLAAQWPHVSALITVGAGAPGAALADEAKARNKAVFGGRLRPDAVAAASVRGRGVLAFAGIGRPEKFFATLRETGANVVRERPFADHHPYTPAEVRAIIAEARAGGLVAVTTEKDRVRIAALADLGSAADDIRVLPVRLVFDHESAVVRLLLQKVRESRARLAASPPAAG